MRAATNAPSRWMESYMARLSKADTKNHEAALKLLEKNSLTLDDKYFVLENWREDARHLNGTSGAFFTPTGLARDFAIEVTGKYIIDLCAGIGGLAFAVSEHNPDATIICVDINRDYVEVGKKILPYANWFCMDAFDFFTGNADCVIANPPFGNVATHKNKYGAFEYDLIAHARTLAKDGVFIIPQMSCPFRYSGRQNLERVDNLKYEKFRKATGITLSMNMGLDTSIYADEWTIKPPAVEIALGFTEEE